MTELITACLLHADFHVMESECWGATLDWYTAHQDVPEAQRRDAYQAEVERAMLNSLQSSGHHPSHLNPGMQVQADLTPSPRAGVA